MTAGVSTVRRVMRLNDCGGDGGVMLPLLSSLCCRNDGDELTLTGLAARLLELTPSVGVVVLWLVVVSSAVLITLRVSFMASAVSAVFDGATTTAPPGTAVVAVVVFAAATTGL